jgi:pantoate--beta-alanine ligase
VFVNPTQFGPGEDLERYPRTLEADAERCRERGVAAVFAPQAAAMYPPGDETRVRVGATAADLCGAFRPGHFEGVCTVVAKLFLLVGPCVALFGRKDYQQFRVIERMVRDLFLPVEVVGMATVREPDGLALSSRNAYLSTQQRERALALPRGLALAAGAYRDGERSVAALRAIADKPIRAAVDSIDYLTIADADSVVPLGDGDSIDGSAVLAVAAHIGPTRLIDNLVLGRDPAPMELD